MANILTNPGVLILDTVGIIKLGPVYIRGWEFLPNAAADVFNLSAYDLTAPLLPNQAASGTITNTTTFTNNDGGTALPSTFAAGDLFEIFETSGAAANKGIQLITTGNNTVVVCSQAGWTNEATKAYSFRKYSQYLALGTKTQATTLKGEGRWYGNPGLRFESLALTTLSASSKLLLYI
ncbi:MAG: hypothetical protein MZV70_54245 [Desulfobacterales bacterium]|nr:hypothetical protein [Desulfobacterales bacterium]